MVGKFETNAHSPNFKLEVPLDVSGIEDFKPDRPVKVAVQNTQGAIESQMVKFNDKGDGVAKFTFEQRQGKLSIAIGPPDATDKELFGLQTLRVDIPVRLWKEPHLVLPPVKIPPFHWRWWWRWCRTFTVRGRVLCPDGRPVPGAKVCAFDVDAWWWWSSKQLVGCSTTDATGSFEIRFRWCCGWWPLWWWRMRTWYIDPFLIERIIPVLEREPQLHPVPLPDPVPDLHIFEHLVGSEQFALLNLIRHLSVKSATPVIKDISADENNIAARASFNINPTMLAELREPLAARLPRIPELEQLHIWPWWPWQPWSDCTPDIIFRVTQDCVNSGTVILEENYGQARWNIPTDLDVTLSANDKACCFPEQDDEPEGFCAVIIDVCGSPITRIGGNPGAPVIPNTEGYLDPGRIFNGIHSTNLGDRPLGGNIIIHGHIGNAIDYYEFQWSNDGGAIWNDMPNVAVGDIPRQYWIPATNTFDWAYFLNTIDGRLVFESRRHYEDTHAPGTWGLTRFWMATNYLSMINWLTRTPFINGKYHLRIKGWQLVGGNLDNPLILPICSTQTPAELVLRIDNRLEGAASGHPVGDPNHPCGSGTVHTCTLEPDTDFVGVRIIDPVDPGHPTPVGACSNVKINPDDILEVDFFAHDPEEHLARYTLQTTYKENLAINLLDPIQAPSLNLPGFGLFPLGGTPVPAAVHVGPGYFNARLDGAAPPVWAGGGIRLRVKAIEAFPETCCYQLELRAHKRTMVDWNYSDWNHTNYSEYSFMILV